MDIKSISNSILEGKSVRAALRESVGIIGAKPDDKILDTKTNKVGTVVKTGQSGNNDLVYVDFDGKVRKINAIDDAQIHGRYEFAEK